VKPRECPPNTVCAFSGEPIREGLLVAELIKKTFTDRALIRYPSEYLSVDFALLISPVIKTEKNLNILRNYSFFASENKFMLLTRDEILNVIVNIPETPFQFGVTYSNKKHIAYKTPVNFDADNFIVCTDLGPVEVNRQKLNIILPIAKAWYTVLPDKRNTNQLTTYFSKANIKGEPPSAKQVVAYGVEKFYAEDAILKPFRKTMMLELILFILNKTT
jgi:CRISPR type IV-associated protein Csf1